MKARGFFNCHPVRLRRAIDRAEQNARDAEALVYGASAHLAKASLHFWRDVSSTLREGNNHADAEAKYRALDVVEAPDRIDARPRRQA